MKPDELPPQAQLMRFIVGKWISKPIYVAAELGVADMLANGPRSVEELAQESGTLASSLHRILRALASVGIFTQLNDGTFELTPMAECLKTGAMRSIALLFESEWSDKAWSRLLDSVKTGDTAFEMAHGLPVSDWLEQNPRAADVFNEANAIKAMASHSAIIYAYDFSGISKLTDVGGGLGVLMTEILKANPSMEGIIMDVPSVIRKTSETIRQRGIEDRCQAIGGDFFQSIPSGSDAYLLSNILHDWPDEQCRMILTNCRRAMKTESKLLVMEMIITPGNEPSVAKLLDVEMLVTTGGRERTEVEFRDLFDSSGLELSRIIPTRDETCIIEGSRR